MQRMQRTPLHPLLPLLLAQTSAYAWRSQRRLASSCQLPSPSLGVLGSGVLIWDALTFGSKVSQYVLHSCS